MHHYVDSPTWLLDVFAKATLLLAIVWLGSLLIRKRSAAAQHRWWTLGFVGCFLIPVVSLIAPTWTPPLIPGLLPISETPRVDAMPVAEAPAVPNHGRINAAHSIGGVARHGDNAQRANQPRPQFPQAAAHDKPQKSS